MKNKKGFTLIELLAIIVILAVIAVITVPIILNIIDNAEKGSAQDSALGYKDALQKYYATKSVQSPEQELPSGYMEISELPSDFTVSGENPIDGWVKLKNGIVEEYSLKYKDYVVTKYLDKDAQATKGEYLASIIEIPNSYQEIEYLESTGTQHIEIPYIVDDNTKIKCDAQFTELDASINIISYFGGNDTSKWFYAGYSGTENSFVTSRGCTYSQTQDWASRTISTFNSNQSYGASSIYLFARKYQTYLSKSKTKIYGCKFYDDNMIVRDLVPVIRKSDNKSGMLDLANYSRNFLKSNITKSTTAGSATIQQTEDSAEFIITRPQITENDTSATLNIDITLPAGTYTLSVDGMNLYERNTDRIFIRDIDGNVIINNVETGKPKTFTLSETTNINRISFVFNAQSTYENQLVKVMLNEGSTALPYEPYKKSFYINEGTGEFITGPEI